MIMFLGMLDVHSQGLRGISAYVQEQGHDVWNTWFKSSTYHDKTCTSQDIDDLIHHLKMQEPDYIGISVKSSFFQLFCQISDRIRKELPWCKIIVGGAFPTGAPQLCKPYANWVVVGEGEIATCEILDGKYNDGILVGQIVEDLDALPPAYYGGRDTYVHSHVMVAGGIETSHMSYSAGRGCPFFCTYCHESVINTVYGKKHLRQRSPKRCFEDIMKLHKRFNAWNFSISDSCFMMDQDYLEEWADLFEPTGFKFNVSGMPNYSNLANLKALKRMGTTIVRYGVQSGSQKIRSKLFNRKDTLDKILEIGPDIEEAGLKATYDFIINNPYDTPETMMETRNFIKKLPPQSNINCYELRWFPGTPLTEKALRDGYITPDDIDGSGRLRIGGWMYSYSQAWGE